MRACWCLESFLQGRWDASMDHPTIRPWWMIVYDSERLLIVRPKFIHRPFPISQDFPAWLPAQGQVSSWRQELVVQYVDVWMVITNSWRSSLSRVTAEPQQPSLRHAANRDFLKAPTECGCCSRDLCIITTLFVGCKHGGRSKNVSSNFDPFVIFPDGEYVC